jgi:hypothetical protein
LSGGEEAVVQERIRVQRVIWICLVCPSLWKGTTFEGLEVYIRYRHGQLRGTVAGEVVYCRQVGDDLDGFMSYEAMVQHTRDVFSWPEVAPPEPPEPDMSL